ncbi:class I SAM-dependent rRNA methyltransferase [Vaginisenegalia massiliensis]|uniref:class I SAM-dependent rRNA methyltransferase n=1 Tax=Vaginisenegalia massiliensis TaxID=2058294 RepID=UPI000F523737|nr:class I SAM-dependent rRNA methyltransferase [Vaginisenegalia massiliensis]
MKKYTMNPLAIKRLKRGEKLLQVEDFADRAIAMLEEGQSIELVDDKGRFLAYALVGHQNKGLAWTYSNQKNERWSQDWVSDCIEQAIRKRDTLLASAETNAFRLFNGEGDGIGGMTLDWYAGYVQINWYSLGLYQYRKWVIEAVTSLLDVIGIYETKRFNGLGEEVAIDHSWGQTAPQPLIILENNVRYAVYLGHEWMTGIFLDQREVRSFVKTQAQAGKVLNLFSYTGAFSVAAALGGAQQTVSVDVAKRSLERTQEQFALNGIEAKVPDHEIRVMDVFDYIQYAKRHQLAFEWVICDPPSFARTKKYRFRAEKDYLTLARDLLGLTQVGGMCLLSTNHAAYDKNQFIKDIQQAMQEANGSYQIIQQFGLPEDFPTSPDKTSAYLKVVIVYRQA